VAEAIASAPILPVQFERDDYQQRLLRPLGIPPPRIEDARSSPAANYYPLPRAAVPLARLLDGSQGTE